MDGFDDTPAGDPVQPCPLQQQKTALTYWVEIELVGEDDTPVGWEAYSVTLPDGSQVKGFLDASGLARIENIAQNGSCQVSFPDLDQHAWSFIETTSARPR